VSQAEELKDALDALTSNEFVMGDHHSRLQGWPTDPRIVVSSTEILAARERRIHRASHQSAE